MIFNVRNSTSGPLTRPQTSFFEAGVAAAGKPSRLNLARSVYCVLGIPIDAINLTAVVRRIETAAAERAVLLISTPNLNFLAGSLSDPEFRESLLNSDLCPTDGMPIIWIARLLGLPIKERAAGADILEQLQIRGTRPRRLKIFLFGGAEGVAAAAARKLNSQLGGVVCVGTMNPGFCDVDQMSQDHFIDAVNSSGADLLVLSLGAKKGQLWLQRNHSRLTIPVRSHLGAAINFQAGTFKRAPRLVRACGFEWLWRIKEERYLWRRYRDDGFVLLRLLLTRVLPLAILTRWQQLKRKLGARDLLIKKTHDEQSITISLCGAASEKHVAKAITWFEDVLTSNKDIIIDLSGTVQIDARFLGLLLMLRKELRSRGKKLRFKAVPHAIERMFYLNELGFLLSADFAG